MNKFNILATKLLEQDIDKNLTTAEQALIDKINNDGHKITGIEKSPSSFRVHFDYNYGGQGSHAIIYNLRGSVRNTLANVRELETKTGLRRLGM
jgi:hypothetical protein